MELINESMEKSKEIIGEFEKLKSDYSKRLNMGTRTLTTQEQSFLNFLFTEIRYVLTRFGRLVSIYEVILQRYRMQSYRTSTLIKKPPDITKIINSFNRDNSSVSTPTSGK